MPTQTEIVNLAKIALGESQLLTDIDVDAAAGDSSALVALALWDPTRRKLLRDVHWPFARKYLALTLFTGSTTTAATPDNIFAYEYPADAVDIRRLTTCMGRQNCNPPPWHIGRKQSGGNRLIMTSLADAMAEYTVDVTDPDEWDDSFIDMFVLKLAVGMAGTESRMTEIVKALNERYAVARQEAVSRALAEAEYAITSGEVNPEIRELYNLALTMIGISRSAVGVDPETNFAVLWPRLCFDDERDYVLRDFPWPFARKYADLTLIAGSSSEPVNNDWMLAYRCPEDCLFARRITTGLGKQEIAPPPFAMGSNYALANDDEDIEITLSGSTWTIDDLITLTASEELFSEELVEVGGTWGLTDGTDSVSILITAFVSTTVIRGTPLATVPAALRNTPLWQWTRRFDGPVIFSDYEEANLEYTRTSTDPSEWDSMFRTLLARRLAWQLAPSMAKGKRPEERAELCERQYFLELARVQRSALNEQQKAAPQDADWISGR